MADRPISTTVPTVANIQERVESIYAHLKSIDALLIEIAHLTARIK